MIDPAVVKIIKENYHAIDHNNDYSKNNLGFGFIHYALIRNIRPVKILVVGSQKGFVPAMCALACKDERVGHVDFIDAGYGADNPKSWGGLGIWKKVTNKYFDKLGVDNWISLYCVTTKDFTKKFPDNKYQYIYIDGDHSYEGVWKDFDLLYPMLEDGGYLLFHDVCVDKQTPWGQYGVKKFWNEMIEDSAGGVEMMTFPFESGLGIIRK